MDKEKILLVDDEHDMRRLIKIYLGDEYEIIEASNGKEALKVLQSVRVNLILLDIMMPEMDGWDVCKEIRKEDKLTPILMLTARSDVHDKVNGLKMGADDYVTKPFDPTELTARVEALLRRSTNYEESLNPDTLTFLELTIEIESRKVQVHNEEVILTPKEFDLLVILASNPKRVFTREVMLNQIWKFDDILDERTVDTHIKNIREKLKRAGLSYNPVKTVWGVGYKFIGERP
jgi:two-component system response regulator ResD